MGLLVVVVVVLALLGVFAAYAYVVRPKRSGSSHGWLALIPLVILFGWVLETILLN